MCYIYKHVKTTFLSVEPWYGCRFECRKL